MGAAPTSCHSERSLRSEEPRSAGLSLRKIGACEEDASGLTSLQKKAGLRLRESSHPFERSGAAREVLRCAQNDSLRGSTLSAGYISLLRREYPQIAHAEETCPAPSASFGPLFCLPPCFFSTKFKARWHPGSSIRRSQRCPIRGGIAQLVERLVRNEKVWGSNPHTSTSSGYSPSSSSSGPPSACPPSSPLSAILRRTSVMSSTSSHTSRLT